MSSEANEEATAWRYDAGERHNRVTVWERRGPGSPVYARTWSAAEGRYLKESLGFRVRDEEGNLIEPRCAEAESYAMEQAAKLRQGMERLRQGVATLAQVFKLYLRHRTPQKGEKAQKDDHRKAEFFERALGSDTVPADITLRDWEWWLDGRRTGRLGARGHRVDKEDRRPLSPRSLEAHAKWLNAVFNWATDWKTAQGNYLLDENPVRGYEVPHEKNPERAAVTQARHEAMLEVAPRVKMEVRWNGKRQTHESWLPELLAIANGTGRRIRSIVRLRVEDLHLDSTPNHPHGAVSWRAEDDKQGYRWPRVPIDGETHKALERALAKRKGLSRVGKGPLFPRATDPDDPITTDLACRWWRRAEEKIDWDEHLDLDGPMPRNRTWHGYRAKFARETKHLPDADRAAVGGWKSAETIRRVYDGPDEDTMLSVVMERGTLRREAR